MAAVTAGIPLNLVQKWLGHAQLSTTAVYANTLGGGGAGHRPAHVGLNGLAGRDYRHPSAGRI